MLFNWWECWGLDKNTVCGKFKNEKVVCFEWEVTSHFNICGEN